MDTLPPATSEESFEIPNADVAGSAVLETETSQDIHQLEIEKDAGETDSDAGSIAMNVHQLDTAGEPLQSMNEDEVDPNNESTALDKKEPQSAPEGSENLGNDLFVSGIASRMQEDELQQIFSKFGTVTHVRIMREPVTKASRGFGFLSFSTVEEATSAIDNLNSQEFYGRVLNVQKAKRSRPHSPTPGKYMGYDRRRNSRDFPSNNKDGGYRRNNYRDRDSNRYRNSYRPSRPQREHSPGNYRKERYNVDSRPRRERHFHGRSFAHAEHHSVPNMRDRKSVV